MKYYDYLDKSQKSSIFYKEPEEINRYMDIGELRYALGALIYIPAIKKDMLIKAVTGQVQGLMSMVMCLEDSVGIAGEHEAIENIKTIFSIIRERKNHDKLPFIFIRPQNIEQLKRISHIVKNNKDFIKGIVIPKALPNDIPNYIEVLDKIQCNSLNIMPILETRDYIYEECKRDNFSQLRERIKVYRHRILSIRMGVTDLLGSYGLRRSTGFTIYDNLIYKTFATDIINYLYREDCLIPVSGGVSEYYDFQNEEILQCFIKEVNLDKFNGFIGKTVIHPNQMKIVQALYVIPFEDYIDALSIIENANGSSGVLRSCKGDRMNEINPHYIWAENILMLSKIYGVYKKGVNYSDLWKI